MASQEASATNVDMRVIREKIVLRLLKFGMKNLSVFQISLDFY